MVLHIPASPPPTPSMSLHSRSTENSCPLDGPSYPGFAITNPVDCGSYPVNFGSFPVPTGSYPVDGGSYPVIGGSYLVKAGSFPVNAGSNPVNATFIRAQTPRHAHTSLSSPSHRLPNVLLFFFFRILSHQFPIRSSASTTISTAILTHSPSRSIALYIHHHLYTQSEQATPALPPSLYLFISPSLSPSLTAHKHTHTHITR